MGRIDHCDGRNIFEVRHFERFVFTMNDFERYEKWALPLIIVGFLLIFFAMFAGCSTAPKPMDKSLDYQRDLKVYVRAWVGNDWGSKQKIYGFGVVPLASKYKITVFPVGKVDMLTGTTCHREWKNPDPDSSWFKKGVNFEYSPVPDIETGRPCPLDLGIYEKKKGRHGWAMIEFDAGIHKLSARVKCNGSVVQYRGVSTCQAKTGLLQEIKFDRKVDFEPTKGCEIGGKPGDKKFTYLMPAGDCVLHFSDWLDETKTHRHTTFGYSTIPIRGI